MFSPAGGATVIPCQRRPAAVPPLPAVAAAG
jgi:hypothetical protein